MIIYIYIYIEIFNNENVKRWAFFSVLIFLSSSFFFFIYFVISIILINFQCDYRQIVVHIGSILYINIPRYVSLRFFPFHTKREETIGAVTYSVTMYCPQIIYFILSFNYRYIILYNRWSIEERTMNWTNEWILRHSFLFKNRKFAFTLIYIICKRNSHSNDFTIWNQYKILHAFSIQCYHFIDSCSHIAPLYINIVEKLEQRNFNEIQLQILEEGPRLRSAKNISTRNIKTFVQIFDCFDLFEFHVSVK